MRLYETGFVLSPALTEEETSDFIQKMADVVVQKKGRMVKQDVWGKRKLAYPIKKFNEGIYVFFVYEGPGDVSAELERRFKQTDTVVRFLTVKKDLRDQARRKKKKTAEEAARTAEPPAEEKGPARPEGAAAGVSEEK